MARQCVQWKVFGLELSEKHRLGFYTMSDRKLFKPGAALLLGAALASWHRSGVLNEMLNTMFKVAVSLANQQRERLGNLEYIIIDVPQQMPTLPVNMNMIQRRVFGDPPLSLVELARTFKRIGEDARTQGVVLKLQSLQMSGAQLQTLRDEIIKLRSKKKRVVCFASSYDLASYYVSSAADEIVLQEGGSVFTLGLQRNVVFMRDALAALGLSVDVVAISPFKSALDTLAHQEMTPEVRDQLNWLLDSYYDSLCEGIATGRDMDQDAVAKLIDDAPFSDQEALDAGYVDAVVNEERLGAYLNAEHLIPMEKAEKILTIPFQPRPEKYVAVLPITGLIVDGESAKPPTEIPVPIFGDQRSGHLTVVQQVRNLMKNKRAAAVVVYINSGGGSATASEAMTSALCELAADRPVVVYMDSVAGSGGYYIATPAQWIVAQPSTLTGSIGVVTAKFVNGEMLKKLRLNAVEITRGDSAAFASSQEAYTDAQREKARHMIETTYHQFMNRVARSRNMTTDRVDEIGGGRVWTGEQALEHGLVDELGGIDKAIRKAREMAQLAEETPALLIRSTGKPLGPQLAERANPAASLQYMRDSLDMTMNSQAQLLLPIRFEQ